MSSDASNVQRRRRPTVVRKLLIAAADKVFREKGFTQATVEDIVSEAGVSKSVFYRNFRTKNALFSASMLEPFTQFLEDFSPRYSSSFSGPWDEERLLELLRELLGQLEHHLRSNREVLERLGSVDSGLDNLEAEALRSGFSAVFNEMRSWGETESAVWSTPPNLELTDRLIVCMISGMVMFDTWFLSKSDRADREQVIDHMSRMLLYGMGLNDTSSEIGASSH